MAAGIGFCTVCCILRHDYFILKVFMNTYLFRKPFTPDNFRKYNKEQTPNMSILQF